MHVFIASLISALHSVKTRLNSSERGATMVEYGIMVAFIAVVVMAVVVLLGPKVADLFTQVSTAL
jgi:pilus assembly protein Flp/PilA